MNNKLIRKEYPRGKRTYTKPLLGPLEAITAHTSEQNGLGNNVERPPSLSTCRARLGAGASCSSTAGRRLSRRAFGSTGDVRLVREASNLAVAASSASARGASSLAAGATNASKHAVASVSILSRPSCRKPARCRGSRSKSNGPRPAGSRLGKRRWCRDNECGVAERERTEGRGSSA